MSEFVAVVPESGVEDTGAVSFRFLFEAELPAEAFLGRAYGTLARRRKSPDHVNPFKLVRGEAGAIGDDGTPQWSIMLIHDNELVMAGSVDSVVGETGLQELLKDSPDCVVLVPPEDVEPLGIACAGLGNNLTVYQYEGRLATS